MLKLVKTLLLISLFLVFSLSIHADEGMWMPHQMKDLNLETEGLKMDPNDLYKTDGTGLMSAVVYLGGGTAEFVSPHGLLLTNHHVAFGAIQRASDKEHDYITNGFLANTLEEEIPAPGYIADVLIGYDDVTKTIHKALKPGMTPLQRFKTIDKISKKLIAQEEKKAKDRRCIIKTMYSGNKYYLFKFKRLRDLRLVYAPPQSIGNYGGDIDNWMWPRHTGDFSYLRAYVSKDNIGADFSKDNVPYQPKVHLKLSLDGLKEGDFTFVMGYPGRTYRNFTLAELKRDIDRLKERRQWFNDILSFLAEATKDDRSLQIKYAGMDKGLNNAVKNYTGKLEGFEKMAIIEKKKKAEEKFLKWLDENPSMGKKYNAALDKLDAFIQSNIAHERKNLTIRFLSNGLGSELLAQATTIYRTAVESQKPDIQREEGYQQRDLPFIEQRVKMAEREYELETDKAMLKYLLKKMRSVPAEQCPLAFKQAVEKGDEAIDAFVDALYKDTQMANPEKRLSLLKLTPAKLLKLNDPMINLAAEIEKEAKDLREKDNAITQEHQDLKELYMEAVLVMHNGALAPDANSSIRFTYGPVKGYSPKDAVVFLPFTTLKGVMEKETGEFPFIVPEKLKKLHEAKDFGRYADKNLNDVVTCFLNTTNVTGGNSGSPVLNAKGEQVGIVFDMTYESVIGDYYIIPEFQRTIHVDVRYVLFVTEKFSGALHLIKEMGL